MTEKDNAEELRLMNIEIQVERRKLKEDSRILVDRKKELQAKESEYLKVSFEHFQANK